jgi:choice-of-anchor C domain-containing protein
MKLLGVLTGAALVLCAHAAGATTVTIVNGSFENNTLAVQPGVGSFTTLGGGDTSITGWTVGGAGVDYINGYWPAEDGTKSLDLSALDAGSISQVISGLTINQAYKVTFALAANPGSPDPAQTLVSAGGNSQTYDSHPAGSVSWAMQTFFFVATAAQETLTFLSLTHNASGPALDNVAISATPIPPAILLFGSALAGMGFLGYRRKQMASA